MASDDDFSRNYDYCVSMLSSSFDLLSLCPEMDKDMIIFHLRYRRNAFLASYNRGIRTVRSFCRCDFSWFDRIKQSGKLLLDVDVKQKKMSDLTNEWILKNVRELDHPYMKQTHVTNLKTLDANNFVDWVTTRADDISQIGSNCWLSFQIQHFGGKHSQFYNNRNNGTSYSWRDSTLVCTLDCFYNAKLPRAKQTAQEWQSTNDSEGIGPGKKFSNDWRVLWGSYGDPNMANSWPYYYEYKATYDKLCEIKHKVDPDNVFSPYSFCVGKSP